MIDKERLVGEGAFGGDPGLVWRARLFLFVGFAFMAGGLAGSVVSCLVALCYALLGCELMCGLGTV